MAVPETADAEDFIRTHTVLAAPPLVPEISLHLAGDALDLWHRTERQAAAPDGVSGTLPPPYWAFAWPGGQALARYLLDHPAEAANRHVLDFGAGSGLIAIAAALRGATTVLAADIDAFAAAAMRLNARANAVALEVTTDDIIGTAGAWDTILVGDMCYERPLAERLTAWLRRLVANGARVLVADPGRSYFPDHGVSRIATYTVQTSLDLEDRTSRETSVYLLGA